MITRTSVDLQSDEAPVVISAGNDTKNMFDIIWSKLGPMANRQSFASLSAALTNLLTALNKIRGDAAKKKNALTTSLKMVDYSVIRIPKSAVPDLTKTARTINQVISGYTSLDIQRLHIALGAAQMVRVPTEITDFERKKIAQVAAKLSAQITAGALARDNVKAIKGIVDSKL